MTGRRPFSELIKDWPPERRRRVEEGTARLSAEVEAAMAAERVGKRTPRDTVRYHLREGNKVIHAGITNDPQRREAEHQRERPNSRLAQQGPKVTRASAEAWERRQAKQGKPTQGYRK